MSKPRIKAKPQPHYIDSGSMERTSGPLFTYENDPPSVYYTPTAWHKIWAAVQVAQQEVGWLGLVDKLDDTTYLVTDIFVPRQEVSPATTDIEPDAVAELVEHLITIGEDPSKLRYWGHSHVLMNVTPSMTDEEQVEEYLEDVDWFIRGIYNKRGQAKVDVYDVKNNLLHQCVDNRLQPDPELVELITRDIEENVTERHYPMKKKNHQKGLAPPAVHPPHHGFWDDDENVIDYDTLITDPFYVQRGY